MPRHALLLLLAALVAGCVVGDSEPDSALEAPTFEPEPEASPAPQEADISRAEPSSDATVDDDGQEADEADPPPSGSDPDDGDDDAGGDDAGQPDPGAGDDGAEDPDEPAGEDQPAEPAPTLRSRVSDPRGDTESTRLTSGPNHADLVGGRLVRHPEDGYRLEIELDGGAPEHARDGDHTMNVASFYDVTGDGHVDVEVWANLADGGWDTAQFDNRRGEAAFSDDDEVTVAVEEGRLVLRFPLSVLDGAERLRWAVASEWGRYEQLGSPLSVRDEMPDGGAPAPFPG